MTTDERRALAFIAALLLLSAAVRFAALPEPVAAPGSGFDLSAHIGATEAAVAEAERRARPLGDGERIDPNTAPADELDRLPGIGLVTARRIVADRDANGHFRSTEDLARVPGIGAATVARIAPFLTTRAAARSTASAGSAGSAGFGAAAAGAGSAGSAGSGGMVAINSADVEALMTLPGVGPVVAARIVAYRDSAGPFLAVDSLAAVKGIGPATLDRIRPRVSLR